MNFKKDNIYQHTEDVIDFTFDKKVAQVFPDMAHRSIPGYTSLLTIMQAVFRTEFKQSNQPLIYDLGCSVGGVTLALANVLSPNTHFIGVDISADMLNQYQKSIALANLTPRVKTIQKSIVDLSLLACQGISINFTLQFLNPNDRQAIINKCYGALDKKGLLFIAEKTLNGKKITIWHEQFKRNNGYSDMEIAKKRLAIENVMKIDDELTIIKRCQIAGFARVTQVFHALGFKAWVVKK